MQHRSVKTRAGSLTAAAILAGALAGFGIQSSADASFTLDLRLAAAGQPSGVTVSSTKAATLSSTATGNVLLQVWGQVVGAAGNTAAEGLQDAFFGVGSTKGATNAPTGNLNPISTFGSPFAGVTTVGASTYATSFPGSTYTNADGKNNVGSTNSLLPDGWVFARSTNMVTTGGTAITDGTEFLLGTLSFSVSSAGSAGTSTTLNAIARAASTGIYPAIWQEDGVEADGAELVGTAVTLTVASAGHGVGDTNGDSHVDLTDLNNVLNNFGVNGPGNPGDDNGDNHVDLTDLNDVLNNFGVNYPPEPSLALSAVPEPASLGLVSLAAVGLGARRRRR